ncbi:L,D-transpeptidase family protein [Microbacterium betulae]|uniref:L,D-transpeptidase family protein n=1 Tax=Microbacterium betulae TaxID=2981139 RepID=A0AA97FJP0_9MICO|nr:L,D-transpeptidase family protein [Microbacterium sp. AB]WOF24003.1 L,D-transpeptidase family protein [Microbacterium sp. AB]
MTDLVTKPEPAAGGDDGALGAGAPVEWAPAEPERKRRHLGLWLGIPGGLIVAGAAVCSAILIAPGVVAAGADVGWQTAGGATQTIDDSLATTEITVAAPSGDVTLTGAELGVSADAQAVAEQAFGDHPLWNVGAWNPGSIPVDVTVDAETARAALAEAAPELFTDPVNAEVAYDEGAGAYTAVDAQAGSGVDVDALAASISTALSETTGDVTVEAQTSEVAPAVTTADAQAEVETLNQLVADAGFYVDGEEVIDLEPSQVASWITVTTEDDGFQVSVDEAAVQQVVDGLPEQVNRDVVNEEVVTNSSGEHLRVIQEGQDGWGLPSTDGVAAAFSEQLASGDGAYEVPVEAVPFETTELYRWIEVDKSAGTTILYENDQVVDTYSIALGRPGYDTQEGRFTVYGQLTIQDMGSCDADGDYVPGGRFDYCTADVPWVTYFNGDQGFHGTYWHDNFGAGALMSHGCVNMTVAAAERVYYFAQTGTEVWVHA